MQLYPGRRVMVSFAPVDMDGRELKQLPPGTRLEWASSDQEVAIVQPFDAQGMNAEVIAAGYGTAFITVAIRRVRRNANPSVGVDDGEGEVNNLEFREATILVEVIQMARNGMNFGLGSAPDA